VENRGNQQLVVASQPDCTVTIAAKTRQQPAGLSGQAIHA
jgi:hypothetical protein